MAWLRFDASLVSEMYRSTVEVNIAIETTQRMSATKATFVPGLMNFPRKATKAMTAATRNARSRPQCRFKISESQKLKIADIRGAMLVRCQIGIKSQPLEQN